MGGLLVVTPLLILSVVTLCYSDKIPAEIEWLIEWLRFPSNYESHGSSVSTLIVLFLITLHIFRRLYECLFVSVFSENQMSIIIYIVGLLFYTIMPLSYVVGTDFTSIDGCTGFLGNIKWNHIVGIFLFLWSSWKQMKAAQIFANLRLTKKGAVDNKRHHIPSGDFFQYVSCPHFFFEILIYTSVNIIYWWSCTLAIFVLLFVAVNQIIMGNFSHKWYKDTFRFYPDTRKAIIPFVY
ncbi:hypothetical protein CHS0354_037098 [Potamilus streckersoni]|uniref:Polyprenal reductase n=1 Tax=Potamilus streckersoni TaxID=2493646 RepID=A0AAE0RP04_9BIVA|nr:hypothetical protein CHS0354_037098 [Potamilus streckersoni]